MIKVGEELQVQLSFQLMRGGLASDVLVWDGIYERVWLQKLSRFRLHTSTVCPNNIA